MERVVLCTGVGLLAIAAYGDARTRRIPNALVATVAAVGLLRVALTGDFGAALYTFLASAAIFIATFLLFWRGLLGGGDVKLMTAAVLLVGYRDLFAFLLVMSICGALVALAILAAYKFELRRATISPIQGFQERPAKLTVPYGVAIAAAGVFTLVVQLFALG